MDTPKASIAPAIAQAGSNILGSAMNWATSAWTNKKNKENAETAWNRDVEMWNMNNAYNTPSAQMQRMKDAGLNPALMYGQGNVGNATGSLPKYSAPRVSMDVAPPLDPGGMLTAYQDYRLKSAQIDQVKAQTDAMNERATKDRLYNEWFGDNSDNKTEELLQKIAGMKAGTGYKGTAMQALMRDVARKDELHPYQLQFMGKRNEKFSQEIAKLVAETTGKNIDNRWKETMWSQKARLNSQNIDKMSELAGTWGPKAWIDIAKTQTQKEKMELEMDWYVANFFGKYGIQALNSLTKFIPTKMLSTSRNVGGTQRYTTRKWMNWGNE